MATINTPLEIPDSFIEQLSAVIIQQVKKDMDLQAKSNELPPYPTRTQIRKILEIGDDRISKWIAEGLPQIPFGKETRFDRDDIKQFLNSKKI